MKDSPIWDSLPALLAALGLDGEPRRGLVGEDEVAVREGLFAVLSALGHSVDAREGIEREGLPLVCDAAFLDNYFLSSTLTGVSLTPELVRANSQVRVLAMSSDPGKNAEMVRLGASLAISKSALRRLF